MQDRQIGRPTGLGLTPREDLLAIMIADATPRGMVAAMTEEQAVLARVRYNRLASGYLSGDHHLAAPGPYSDYRNRTRSDRNRRSVRRDQSQGGPVCGSGTGKAGG